MHVYIYKYIYICIYIYMPMIGYLVRENVRRAGARNPVSGLENRLRSFPL